SPLAKTWADAHGVNSFWTEPHIIARGVVAAILAAVLAWLAVRTWRGGLELERAILLFTGTGLLLSPTLHPWYLLWILPWLALFPSPAWLALTGLAPLAYLGSPWVVWAEYVPFFALLAGSCWLRSRRRAEPVLE